MLTEEQGLYVAHSAEGALSIIPSMANRHGLIAGATGTGKTVTLQVMAETFSQAGVPCFVADMKGDLSGISQAGRMTSWIEKRKDSFGVPTPDFTPCPVRFYDVFGQQGHPIRATVSQMGPQLLGRLLGLNDTQAGVLNIVFRIADERGLLILDMKDLRAMLDYVAKHAREYTTMYGNISVATIGAIQRALLQLDAEGANLFFGEPSFDIYDLLQTEKGRGVVSVLAADRLMLNPKLYSTFLLWLLSELYSTLPEVGDQEAPRLVFFFDEAHMLFDGTSKALVDKIEQVVRLIRSKGVGIYFVTQNPTDIPDSILGQLGNRVQHALRAYSPKDQKAVRAAADTFRPNPSFKTEEVIQELETGEALVSFLDEKGAPSVVQRANILFPLSQIGAVSDEQRRSIVTGSRVYGKYDKMIDRESAFEQLIKESEELSQQAEATVEPDDVVDNQAAKVTKAQKPSGLSGLGSKLLKAAITAATATVATAAGTAVSDAVSGKKTKSKTTTGQKLVKNTTSSVTRVLTRDILGNLIK